MILSLTRQIQRLTVRQRVVIFITLILLPVVLKYLPDFIQICPAVDFTITVVSGLLAALLVASSMNDDRSRTERLIDEKLDPLAGELRQVHEGHENAEVDLRQKVDALEEVMRWGFRQLGVTPPKRPILLRGKATFGVPRASSGTLSVRGGSKLIRFRRWVRRLAAGVWRAVYGERGEI